MNPHRLSRCARLRKLLSDGHWHRWDELFMAAGRRYGARLYDIRKGEDGGQRLKIQAKTADAVNWFWRLAR